MPRGRPLRGGVPDTVDLVSRPEQSHGNLILIHDAD